jgi:hypothetical protein
MADEHQPRVPWTSEKANFLGYGTRHDHEGNGYVHDPRLAMRDEPEAIGPAIVDGYAEVAAFHRSQQHAKDVAAMQTLRPLLKAEDRLKDIHRRAKHSHVDLSHEIHIMERDLKRAREKGKDAPKRTLERLGKVESLLDCLPL